MASRILGMGDVLTLIEKAEAEIDQDKAKEMEKKFRKAEFDFNDFLDQLAQMKKMGGIQSILSMLPGMGLPADLNIDDDVFKSVVIPLSSIRHANVVLRKAQELIFQKLIS